MADSGDSAGLGVDWARLPMLCGGAASFTHWPAPMTFERRGRGVRRGGFYRCAHCGSRRFAWFTLFSRQLMWEWTVAPHIETAAPPPPTDSFQSGGPCPPDAAMKCPSCHCRSLYIRTMMELPGDASADEISLQIVGCSSCGFEAVAVYEASRRGAGESSHHNWHHLPPDQLAIVASAIAECPSPLQRSCPCAGHRLLGALGSQGGWRRLENAGIELSGGGPIERV